MPNHVTNKISKEVAALLKNDGGDIDFNVITPMPKQLIDPDPQQMDVRTKAVMGLFSKSNSGLESIEIDTAIRLMFEPLKADQVDLLISAIRNIHLYGFTHWYPWANRFWGTKWNAYNHHVYDEFETFDTAWSCPIPIFIKLSELNPKLTIMVEYADEDSGSNCGTIVYKNGELISSHTSPQWSTLDNAEKEYWLRFALGLTDPDNIDERLADYLE